MSKSKMIWRVHVEDHSYAGNHDYFLLAGDSAAAVEKLAIQKTHRRHKLKKHEMGLMPYVRSIELIGSLNN